MKKKLFCIFGLILIVSAIAYFCHDHSVLPLDAENANDISFKIYPQNEPNYMVTKLLIDKGLNKTEFAREVGISSNTLAKLSKNELVSLEVLVRICRQLDCSLGDVVQLAPPEPPIKSGLERMKKRRPTHEKGGNAYRHE